MRDFIECFFKISVYTVNLTTLFQAFSPCVTVHVKTKMQVFTARARDIRSSLIASTIMPWQVVCLTVRVGLGFVEGQRAPITTTTGAV